MKYYTKALKVDAEKYIKAKPIEQYSQWMQNLIKSNIISIDTLVPNCYIVKTGNLLFITSEAIFTKLFAMEVK